MTGKRAGGRALDEVVESFARALGVLDPDGTHLGALGGAEEAGRRAAEMVVDSAALWREHLGPCYDSDGVRRLLARGGRPVSRQAVSKRKSLLALKTGSGQVVFPVFQFRGGRPVDGLGEVLEALPEALVSRWTVASWLVSAEEELDGDRPIDVLADGAVEAVLAVARHWATTLAA